MKRLTPSICCQISLCFTAGALGAVVNSLSVWLFGASGLSSLLGVGIKPSLTHIWIMPRVAWGGLWGLLFLIIAYRRTVVLRDGVVAGLFPTINMLLVVFPYHGKGVGGLDLGVLTPLCVFVCNTIWGCTAVWWLQRAGWPVAVMTMDYTDSK